MLSSIKFYMYLFCLFLGTLIASSSSSWFLCWLGLEINLMSLIPLLTQKINPYSSETAIKYFIAQALASILIIFMAVIMFSYNSSNSLSFINFMILLALSIKMGAAPLHFWLPQVIQTAKWFHTILILTWQKIAPMLLMIYVKTNFIKFIIISSCIIGALGAINQILIKKIMVYSSILHSGWLISSLMCSENIWLLYFMIYSFISISIITPLIFMPLKSSNEIFYPPINSIFSYILFLNFLSLAGIPPFLGFFMKIITLSTMIFMKMDMIILITLVMSSLVSLFYYMRLMISSMILSLKKYKFINLSTMNYSVNSIFLIFSMMGNLIFPFLLVMT